MNCCRPQPHSACHVQRNDASETTYIPLDVGSFLSQGWCDITSLSEFRSASLIWGQQRQDADNELTTHKGVALVIGGAVSLQINWSETADETDNLYFWWCHMHQAASTTPAAQKNTHTNAFKWQWLFYKKLSPPVEVFVVF